MGKMIRTGVACNSRRHNHYSSIVLKSKKKLFISVVTEFPHGYDVPDVVIALISAPLFTKYLTTSR